MKDMKSQNDPKSFPSACEITKILNLDPSLAFPMYQRWKLGGFECNIYIEDSSIKGKWNTFLWPIQSPTLWTNAVVKERLVKWRSWLSYRFLFRVRVKRTRPTTGNCEGEVHAVVRKKEPVFADSLRKARCSIFRDESPLFVRRCVEGSCLYEEILHDWWTRQVGISRSETDIYWNVRTVYVFAQNWPRWSNVDARVEAPYGSKIQLSKKARFSVTASPIVCWAVILLLGSIFGDGMAGSVMDSFLTGEITDNLCSRRCVLTHSDIGISHTDTESCGLYHRDMTENLHSLGTNQGICKSAYWLSF